MTSPCEVTFFLNALEENFLSSPFYTAHLAQHCIRQRPFKVLARTSLEGPCINVAPLMKPFFSVPTQCVCSDPIGLWRVLLVIYGDPMIRHITNRHALQKTRHCLKRRICRPRTRSWITSCWNGLATCVRLGQCFEFHESQKRRTNKR